MYPGVEITCDTAKIHLLILFEDVNDFLIKAGIKRGDFGKQDTSTALSIFDISEIATKDGALIIPAHIDEYNGLGEVSVSNLKKFYTQPNINAVQVVHKTFLDDSIIKKWNSSCKYAVNAGKAVLTFSDNPHAPQDSKHGLKGIGSRYTWIKMSNKPSLESLRHAFLLPDLRIKNDFVSPHIPYNLPDLWIKSLTVKNATLTPSDIPLKINFNPQLTTIIGGRGSGKSSILRFVRGLFNRTGDLADLKDIFQDHLDFYKLFDPKSKKGVINKNTSIEVEFIRNGIVHLIRAIDIHNSRDQKVTISKYNPNTQEWIREDSHLYIDFFRFDQYSQKHIYEIAQEPNSLRERIDQSCEKMDGLKGVREITKKEFLQTCASIRSLREQISGKEKLRTEIEDLGERIELLQESQISDLFKKLKNFSLEQQELKKITENAKENEQAITDLAESLEIKKLNTTLFEKKHLPEIISITKEFEKDYLQLQKGLKHIREKAEILRIEYETKLSLTEWHKEFTSNLSSFEAQKTDLKKKGVEEISNYEKLIQLRLEKQLDLEKFNQVEQKLEIELESKNEFKNDYFSYTKDITERRKSFVSEIMKDGKIKVLIKPYRDKTDFINRIRSIIQREQGFDADIDYLTSLCFKGNVEQKIEEIRDVFYKIRKDERVPELSGYFANLVKNMNDSQIDELELFIPEDEIEIKYKPSISSLYKPLSTASAGQKTTAILTFILSHGTTPLLLDQPEDDLDNRLVYELIVDRLKQAKLKRQIIVVTHNANIPVNGDAEYVISMDSECENLQILCAGSVEHQNIKKEICDVMEGSEKAFKMRSDRYKQI